MSRNKAHPGRIFKTMDGLPVELTRPEIGDINSTRDRGTFVSTKTGGKYFLDISFAEMVKWRGEVPEVKA